MKGMKKIFAYGVALTSLWSGASSLNAQCCEPCQKLEPWNSISLSGGWRYDRITTKMHSSDAVSVSSASREHLKLKNLNTWQIGGQLHWSIPNLYCEDIWWLNQFYVRGYAYRGWVTSGRLQNRATDDLVGITDSHGGKIHKGRTVDGTVGAGFLYPFCSGWAIGPVGGWSYEQVHVSTRSRGGSSSGSGSDVSSTLLDGIKNFTSTFRGPWVGFDVAYVYSDCCRDLNLRFEAGYEYHWATWRGSSRLRGLDITTTFKGRERFRSNNAYGNLGYFNAWWLLCDNWELGLGVKYQSWTARRRHNSSSSSDDSSSRVGRRLRNVDWDNVQVNADIGYSF
jgi:hypothetical protein